MFTSRKIPELAFVLGWRGIFCLILLSLLVLLSTAAAQEPLGAGDEVWVDVIDTVFVGQEVEFQVYIANSDYLLWFDLGMRLESTDGAQWDWVFQSEPPWFEPGDSIMLSLNHDSRFWGDNLESPGFGLGYCYVSMCEFEVGGVSIAPPHVPAGGLERAYSIHLRPTSPGTISIDTASWPPATDQWHFGLAGAGNIHPVWNGPFHFTVVEPPKGDVNCDGAANVADAVYIVNWIFKGGPEPCR